jgi:hypothetical protein
MQQFVEDELLRAPLLFDQVAEGTLVRMRRTLAEMTPGQRNACGDMVHLLMSRQAQMAEYFTRSLREQVKAELGPGPRPNPAVATTTRSVRPASLPLALVDEAEVAIDVEVAHTIESIKAIAEYEVRELQTYTAALVGDMDMTRDHNPFRAEAFARALWAAAQALPLSRGQQAMFMRHAGEPLAQVLRQAYASSASRLEAQGVEPAAFRTLVRSGPTRRDRHIESTLSPVLQRVRDKLPASAARDRAQPPVVSYDGQRFEPERDRPAPLRQPPQSRQAQELVDRLFEAIRTDTRVPADVLAMIMRLHGPAMQLAQREAAAMSDDGHPMWTFANRLAYEAEMTPDPGDPERVRLLRVGLATIKQLASEPEQRSSLYTWAIERLEIFIGQRLARRCTAVASQIGALQKLEDKLLASHAVPTTLHGTLDVPQLDTVPAELMERMAPESAPPSAGDEAWLDGLRPGEWVRMFLQGRWVHVQLLWPGERREIWLFGDGASDATFAVRRRALLNLKQARLLKKLTRRSLVRRAARQVHEQVLAAA